MSEFLNITLGGIVDEMAAKYPDNDALVYVDRNLRLSYKEFNETCRKVAKGFLKMGIKKGDHVAIWATNYPEWVITMFATAKIGAVLVTVNTNYKIFELEYLLKQSDAMTLLLIDEFKGTNYVEILNELIPELKTTKEGELKSEKLPFLKNVIGIDKGKKAGMFTWDDLMKMGEDVPDEVLDKAQANTACHDIINMQYTSGTTGFPKGVMLTHYNILNNGFYIGESMRLTHKDRLCIPVPFFHCFGCVLAILACVTHGSTMVPVEYFSPIPVFESVQKEKCTALHGVPSMFIFLLEHPDFSKYDFSTLRTGIMAGSPCPVEVMRKVIEKMNMSEITIAYGQTESSPVITQTTTDDTMEHRVSTIGKTLAGIETKIINPETGKTVPPNVTGEICARGYSIMRGYYKMEEATKAAIDEDGWLHTGDLGVVDEEGYFKITGRIKDMIIRGGENIYPREIEELLYTNSAVKDVQVVGIPSKKYGEEVLAYIILNEGMTISEEEVKEYVRKNMSRHKVPSYVDFVSEFPMNAAGKILKYKLREMGIEKYNLQEAAAIETA